MTTDITSPVTDAAETKGFLSEDWFDPLEAGVRPRIRSFIEELLEAELEAALGRKRYARGKTPETEPSAEAARSLVSGHRHGHRERGLMGTFGAVTVCVPRARLATPEGGTKEWRNASLPAYQRLTRRAEALIAGAYLSGTNTRRVRRALAALFGGAVGKDVVSRVWRKVKTDWDAWTQRDLSAEPIIRLILDGTVVRVRLDRKATAISLLVVLGVRQDGQKVLLAVKNMGGESEAAWRAILDDLVGRGLRPPEFVIVDGAPGLEKALAALWPDVPAQRCTVHKHRNLLAHAPDRLHEEISADYTDMIYAATPTEVAERRKAFLRKWRLKCQAVADKPFGVHHGADISLALGGPGRPIAVGYFALHDRGAQIALAAVVGDVHRTREGDERQQLVTGTAELALEIARQIAPGRRRQIAASSPSRA